MNPKVFISHAFEDKERFVLQFSEKLRSKGVDAWLDKWEMMPGDSLVEKIFEEGIKNASAVIVVLSEASVTKPWVLEELNISFVNHVNKVSKLIPVIIDKCDIPECLKNTIWQKIEDINSYEEELERIVMSIYGEKNKPPLGAPPRYTGTAIDRIGALNNIDNLVMNVAFDLALEKGVKIIGTRQVLERCLEFDISESEVLDSLNVLDEIGYIKLKRVIGPSIPSLLVITDSGFEDCSRSLIDNYKEIYEAVAYQVVNLDRPHSSLISEKLDEKKVVVENVLNHLKNRGLIKTVTLNTGTLVSSVTTSLKRALESGKLL